jgi:hypothetical protein
MGAVASACSPSSLEVSICSHYLSCHDGHNPRSPLAQRAPRYVSPHRFLVRNARPTSSVYSCFTNCHWLYSDQEITAVLSHRPSAFLFLSIAAPGAVRPALWHGNFESMTECLSIANLRLLARNISHPFLLLVSRSVARDRSGWIGSVRNLDDLQKRTEFSHRRS